jgi:Lipase (class 3)
MASIIQNFPAEQLSKKGPALLRTVEAWYFSLSAYACSVDNGVNAPQPSIWVPGKDAAQDAGCLCSYAKDTSTLVLAFDGGLPLVIRSLELHYSKEKLTTQRPFYFDPEDGAGDDAEVVTEYNTCFSSLLPGIETALSRLVPTEKTPLKVLCTGFCMGGGLAVLAAPWAALKWPTSDVSCITFGAPIIGNPGFNKSFNLLVGLNYRGIYRLDPVPDMPRPFNKLSIKLCATGDDFYFDGRGSSHSRNPRRPLLTLHHNLSDHTTAAYEQGITAAVASPSPGVPATADGRAVLVDPLVAGQVPELAERGDCSCAQCPRVVVPGTGMTSTSTTANSTVYQTDMNNFEKVERNLESNIALHQIQEKENAKLEQVKMISEGSRGGTDERMNKKMHGSSTQIEAAPEPSGMASSSHAFFSCFRCLSSPVAAMEKNILSSTRSGGSGGGDGSGGNKGDPRAVRLDQFWAEMHLQAEAMRQSSPEVMSYMKEVFSGKTAEPPEIVQTAMAAAVRLGHQADGDTFSKVKNTNNVENNASSSGSGGCGEDAAVELATPGGASGGTTILKEKDRIKVCCRVDFLC